MIKKFFLKKKKNPCIGKRRSHTLCVVQRNKKEGVGQDKCVHGKKTSMTVASISRVRRGEENEKTN